MKNFVIIAVFAACVLMGCQVDRRPSKIKSGIDKAEFEQGVSLQSPPMLKTVAQPVKRDRMLIKNGDIRFSVADIEKTKIEIAQLCKQFNGYIANEVQQRHDHRVEYNQVIRIPAERFEAFIKLIENAGLHVDSRNITSEDITEEFIDIEARLKTKRALDDRYHALLLKAKNVTEMLAIEEQIGSVRAEIESMQGRLNFLSSQVGFSTLTITYYQNISENFAFGSRLVAAVSSGWKNLLLFVVGVMSAWPFVLILAVATFLINRWVKRNTANKLPVMGDH